MVKAGFLRNIGGFGIGLVRIGLVRIGLVLIASPVAVAQGPASGGGSPTREYRVLRAAEGQSSLGRAHSTKELSPPAAILVAKPPQPYAYGWFGAKPQMHWHRQFGGRRSYTQWTLK